MSKTSYECMVGDRSEPLCGVMRRGNGNPLDLSVVTVKIKLVQEGTGTPILDDVTSGVTQEPTQAMTLSASTTLAACVEHGLIDGDEIVPGTSGSLSGSGLTVGSVYFAVQVTENFFGLATTPGGVSVIAGAGTGNHTFLRRGGFEYSPSAAAVQTAGRYRIWARAFDGGGLVASLPNTEFGIPWVVKAFGY